MTCLSGTVFSTQRKGCCGSVVLDCVKRSVEIERWVQQLQQSMLWFILALIQDWCVRWGVGDWHQQKIQLWKHLRQYRVCDQLTMHWVRVQNRFWNSKLSNDPWESLKLVSREPLITLRNSPWFGVNSNSVLETKQRRDLITILLE